MAAALGGVGEDGDDPGLNRQGRASAAAPVRLGPHHDGSTRRQARERSTRSRPGLGARRRGPLYPPAGAMHTIAGPLGPEADARPDAPLTRELRRSAQGMKNVVERPVGGI